MEDKIVNEEKVVEEEETVKLKNNPMALTGFILGILSIFIYAIIDFLPILGIIFSGIGLGTFNPKKEKNKWMAWCGLVLGIVCFLMLRLWGFIHL